MWRLYQKWVVPTAYWPLAWPGPTRQSAYMLVRTGGLGENRYLRGAQGTSHCQLFMLVLIPSK
jgi:hypothetical protein